jgi:protein MPE1
MVPAGTSLIVKRVPVKQQRRKFDGGVGPATGGMGPPLSAVAAATVARASEAALPLLAGGGENERIEALISQGPGWSAGQAVPNRARFMQVAAQKPPPPTYVCHRCQQTGHWINMCPTNGDPKFDFKRIKKVSGFSFCTASRPFGCRRTSGRKNGKKEDLVLLRLLCSDVRARRRRAFRERFWRLWTRAI